MRARTLIVPVATAATLLILSGCFGPTPFDRTGNQGGSTPVSLGLKLLDVQTGQGTLQELNPDDIQLMADLAEEIIGQELPAVSDELAAAADQLIELNNINTFEDIAALANASPEDIVIPPDIADTLIAEAQELFGDINDPSVIDEIVARHAPTTEL